MSKVTVQITISYQTIKEISNLTPRKLSKRCYPEIARILVEHILERYFYPEYFDPDDIDAFVTDLMIKEKNESKNLIQN